MSKHLVSPGSPKLHPKDNDSSYQRSSPRRDIPPPPPSAPITDISSFLTNEMGIIRVNFIAPMGATHYKCFMIDQNTTAKDVKYKIIDKEQANSNTSVDYDNHNLYCMTGIHAERKLEDYEKPFTYLRNFAVLKKNLDIMIANSDLYLRLQVSDFSRILYLEIFNL